MATEKENERHRNQDGKARAITSQPGTNETWDVSFLQLSNVLNREVGGNIREEGSVE